MDGNLCKHTYLRRLFSFYRFVSNTYVFSDWQLNIGTCDLSWNHSCMNRPTRRRPEIFISFPPFGPISNLSNKSRKHWLPPYTGPGKCWVRRRHWESGLISIRNQQRIPVRDDIASWMLVHFRPLLLLLFIRWCYSTNVFRNEQL